MDNGYNLVDQVTLVRCAYPIQNININLYILDTKKTSASPELSKKTEFPHGDIFQNTQRRKPRILF